MIHNVRIEIAGCGFDIPIKLPTDEEILMDAEMFRKAMESKTEED